MADIINKIKLNGRSYNITDSYTKDEIDGLLEEKADISKKAINYYVDSTNGSNSNDGLTRDTAFKTIQYAIDLLPKTLKHEVYIGLAEGTYNEDIYISSFNGGTVTIVGSSNDLEKAVNYNITSIEITNCSSRIEITGVTLNPDNSTRGYNIGVYVAYGSSFVGCNYCRVVSNIKTNIFGFRAGWGSNLDCNNCYVEGVEWAFGARENSHIMCYACKGANNTNGFLAQLGGQIKLASIPSNDLANNLYHHETGGIIIKTNNLIFENTDVEELQITDINTTQINQSAYSFKAYKIGKIVIFTYYFNLIANITAGDAICYLKRANGSVLAPVTQFNKLPFSMQGGTGKFQCIGGVNASSASPIRYQDTLVFVVA